MRFPGFEVTVGQRDEGMSIRRIELDETELTPESNWMEGYPNSDPSEGIWVGRDLDAALTEIRRRLLA